MYVCPSAMKESLSALDLAELYAETLLKGKCEPTEKIFEQLYSMLLQLCDPNFPNSDSLNKFISISVRWSQAVASKRRERKHGLSELHHVIARAFAHHHNYENARNHMLFADQPEEFAKLLHVIREEGGSKSSEAEMFCVLPCLQLLAMHRVHTASKLLTAYVAILNDSPPCSGTRDELFNFIKLLCNSLNLHDIKLFDHLVEAYKPHLNVDPNYNCYLERIGQIFFGTPPKNKNDSFGGLFGNILKGVLGEKKEEDEIFSDSDFEPGSIHTGRSEQETEDAYETAEESDMMECDDHDGQKRATAEIFDDLD
ncbi:Golgi to ER traffic protein 4 [Trichostrongylus colubriformis]|uniref:Golgi to ER traffic protein 4 n=1 Tax=Trichostrongylus colubriformis TaxID=6319 RepID=A0AAN8FIT0_TRICO